MVMVNHSISVWKEEEEGVLDKRVGDVRLGIIRIQRGRILI
jgi:hypothetical protein